MSARDTGERVVETLISRKAKQAYMGAVVTVFALGLVAVTIITRGPLNAIFYAFMFLFAATFFPTLIYVLAAGIPWNDKVGRFHMVLGAIAMDHHYLVQRTNKWEWCAGEEGRVYIDGQWHDVEGEENYSVLGWRPFGILRYKESNTWASKRADTKAERLRGATATDGGDGTTIQRGGFPEAEKPLITGVEGTWLVDLKRVYTRGVKKIGDIDLIETAEEMIERGQVNKKRFAGWRPFVETGAGLVLGVLTGYAYILLS